MGPFGPELLSTNTQAFFTSGALCRRSEKGVIIGRNLIQACAVFFGPSDVDLRLSTTRAIQESIQYGFVLLFLRLFKRERWAAW